MATKSKAKFFFSLIGDKSKCPKNYNVLNCKQMKKIIKNINSQDNFMENHYITR